MTDTAQDKYAAAMADLRRSEARYRAVVEDQTELISRFLPDGTLTFVNEACCRFFGLEKKAILGKRCFAFVPTPTRDRILASVAALSREHPADTSEQEVISSDGRRRRLQWTNRAIFNGTDEVIEIQGVGRDVTEQRLAEEKVQRAHADLEHRVEEQTREWREANRNLKAEIAERRRTEEALRQSKERFRTLFENSPDSIFVEALDGTILDVNPSACRLHGKSRDQLIGRNVLDLVPEEAREAVREDFPKWISGELTLYRGLSLAGDGSSVPVEIVAAPMNYLGRPALLLHVRDVREREEAEGALRRSQEQLQQAQKMEALGRLAGGVAHDFNNLLTSILGYGRLIRDELRRDDPLSTDIEEILHAGERAADLTRRLLTFGRKQIVEKHPVDLNAVVNDAQKLLQRTLGEDIELIVRLGEHLGSIEADPGQLEQLILNLAVNARDAMPEGGTLTIATGIVAVTEEDLDQHPVAEPGDYVTLAARDTGCGMSAEVRDRAFEPFFTTKQEGQGTGLGLSTVYGIVRSFHGQIDVRSEEGAGAAFRIYFPRLTTPAGEPTRAWWQGVLPTGTECILVVEDEPTVRHLTSRLLKSLGYQVLEAANAGESLMICEKHREPIDLVLTDVVMPMIGGPEMIERLRGVRSDFKVLYMTGFAYDEAAPASLLPKHLLILKPFTREILATRTRQVLDGLLL